MDSSVKDRAIRNGTETQQETVWKGSFGREYTERNTVDTEGLDQHWRRNYGVASELLERAWFTITVNSSVAVESTMNGVPCFLCAWFDGDWHDYGKQLVKYSAGYALSSPQEIRRIQELLGQIKITESTRRTFHSPVSLALLDSMLFGSTSPQSEAVKQESTQAT